MDTRSRQHAPGRMQIIFRSLHYRNYRLFFGGQSLSLIGTWIQRIAVPWLVYKMTGSAFLLGIVGFAGQIPTFFLSPIAGVLTDRWNRYHILLTVQILAMVQAFILTILFFTGVIQIWHIIVLSVVLGLVNAFDIPSRQALVIDLVENKEDLGNAIALNSSMVNSARLVGPSIAGLLIASAGEGACFLLNGISYLFVIATLLMIRVNITKCDSPKHRIFHELREGFSYTFRNIPIRAIILLLALASLMGLPYAVLMPIFAKTILKGGSHIYGFLMGASGLGAFTGAIYLASRKSVLGLGRILPLSAGMFGLGLILFALSRYFWLSMVLMVVVGLGMMLQIAVGNTIIQTIVDDDKRGRVMSIYAMAFVGMMPIGSFLAGSAASIIGAPETLVIGGMACILGAVVFARKLNELRKLVRPVYQSLGILPEIASGIQTATEASMPPPD
jgi:MFS family permease